MLSLNIMFHSHNFLRLADFFLVYIIKGVVSLCRDFPQLILSLWWCDISLRVRRVCFCPCRWMSLDMKNCMFNDVKLKLLLLATANLFFVFSLKKKTLFTIRPSWEDTAKSKLYLIHCINHHPFCTSEVVFEFLWAWTIKATDRKATCREEKLHQRQMHEDV